MIACVLVYPMPRDEENADLPRLAHATSSERVHKSLCNTRAKALGPFLAPNPWFQKFRFDLNALFVT